MIEFEMPDRPDHWWLVPFGRKGRVTDLRKRLQAGKIDPQKFQSWVEIKLARESQDNAPFLFIWLAKFDGGAIRHALLDIRDLKSVGYLNAKQFEILKVKGAAPWRVREIRETLARQAAHDLKQAAAGVAV